MIGQTSGGAIATLVGASVWGLIWLPVQHLDQMGLSGLWTIIAIQFAAAVAALGALLLAGESRTLGDLDNWLIGFSLGLSTLLYFCGILLSDVVRVIFLFYTLPVWTILFNRLLFGIRPSPKHYLVIAIALVGLWLLLSGGDSWVPRPQNLGDWCGLSAGATWGLGLALLENRRGASAKAASFSACTVACVLGLVVVAFSADQSFSRLDLDQLDTLMATALPLAALVGLGIQFPVMYLMVWGAQRLSAPTASLLTMSELLAATLSASFILGNSLSTLSWLGGGVIVLAAVIDIVGHKKAPDRKQLSGA